MEEEKKQKEEELQDEELQTNFNEDTIEEMIEEDANFIINGEYDSDVEAVFDNYDNSGGLFSNTSSEDIDSDEDEDIF